MRSDRITPGRCLIWTLALLFVVVPTPGDAELELIDDRVLRGSEVRREEGMYLLTLEDGAELAFPEELVREVRLIASEDPEEDDESQEPTGLRNEGPQTLAGREVPAPRRSEQLEVLGQPSKFREDFVDNSWEPESDWDMDPEKNNNFAPSTWAKDVIDPSWQPKSAFDARKDVMKKSRSTWSKSIVDSSWEPTDGFAKRGGRR